MASLIISSLCKLCSHISLANAAMIKPERPHCAGRVLRCQKGTGCICKRQSSPRLFILHRLRDWPGMQDRKLQLQNNYASTGSTGRYMLRCLNKVQECPDVHTYTFEYQPSSQKKVVKGFKAGQYGSFEFDGLGQANQKTITRTWTISSPPAEAERQNTITLTIKKVGPWY